MEQEAVTQFKGQLRGDLIEPSDARYEEARKVYNAMISRKPRLIAKCVDVTDVITAVHFSRQHGLKVSIRGGGHNAGHRSLPHQLRSCRPGDKDCAGRRWLHLGRC
jgi:FAD/FMN-containing dehydrogenase